MFYFSEDKKVLKFVKNRLNTEKPRTDYEYLSLKLNTETQDYSFSDLYILSRVSRIAHVKLDSCIHIYLQRKIKTANK